MINDPEKISDILKDDTTKKAWIEDFFKDDNFILKMYEILTTNKKFRKSLLEIITPFIIMGASMALFFILHLPSDILFVQNFLKSIVVGNFMIFLHPFNVIRFSKIVALVGLSPTVIRYLFSNQIIRVIIKDLILDAYVKVIIIFKKLGKYKYTKFFLIISDYLTKILENNVKTVESLSRREILKSKINEINKI